MLMPKKTKPSVLPSRLVPPYDNSASLYVEDNAENGDEADGSKLQIFGPSEREYPYEAA